MTKIEEMNLKRNEDWTKTALAHKDGQGKPIEQKAVVFKSVAEKDENGFVKVPLNLDDGSEPKLFKGKSVNERVTVKGIFDNAPVQNAMTGF